MARKSKSRKGKKGLLTKKQLAHFKSLMLGDASIDQEE
jgi:hypothetical protein